MIDECHQYRPLIDSVVDGETSPDALAAIKQHLAQCPDCAKAYQHRLQLSRLVRTEATRFVPSQEFADRMRKAVAPAPKPKRISWMTGGALGASVAALAASLALFAALPPAQDQLTHDLLSAHIRALQGAHLIDVASSDQHAVKPWFNGKTNLSPVVVDMADSGYPLAGGRLDYIDNTSAAVLVYRHAAHVIDVFSWVQTPAASGSVGNKPPKTALRNGYFLVTWSHDHIGYAVVSDLNVKELETFRQQWSQRAGSE